ncbi:SDR family oxidoreductase [Cystobacter fuscus]|uniref:SDR family oxidoreductase n=1 Tax=Cystobacter fuscus TaxID=43 RepID=UPI002B2E44D5|nr:SDR family oxidoreductase [Cystobacter fuscus]
MNLELAGKVFIAQPFRDRPHQAHPLRQGTARGGIALERLGEPAKLGRMATVLLSPVAAYVTGAVISIDGGQLRSL